MYAFGCLAVCRKPGFLAALIPVFILASLLLCPIFFDASVFCREPRVCESCCRRGGI
ncbi:MAG: hypothetical protein ACLR8P_22960 [Clostridium fessum]